MERKLMIIKTLNEAEIAFEDISSQLRHFVKLCCLGGEANNPLYTNGLSFSVLPQTAWTIMTEQEDSLGQAWSPPSPALFNIFHLRLIPTTFTQYTRYL